MDIKKLTRKPFEVDAVQVTEDNIQEVAEWCGGRVFEDDVKPGETVRYVKVKVRYPLNDRQTQAFVGDWVLATRRGYKVYTDNALPHSFEVAESDISANDAYQQSRNIFDEPQLPFTEGPGSEVSEDDQISGKR